ncbi:MAG: hypothetical protein IJY16_04585 [Clostridia bacterium]|nr:hypothetical protein [Clostridia bacterium]
MWGEKMRVLAAMDGKLIPSDGIWKESEGLQLAQRPLGSTLYAPVEGVLAEQQPHGFLLYATGGVRLTLTLRRQDGGSLAPDEVGLDPLVEPGAPLAAGQVLARVEYRDLPAAELRLITHIEGRGSFRPCHVPPLLEGGRTPVLRLQV